MDKLSVAFCDTDDRYRRRFLAYLVEHNADEIAVCAFSDTELFCRELEDKSFDVVLAGEGFQELAGFLAEQGMSVLVLETTLAAGSTEQALGGMKEEVKLRSVFKYQSVEYLIHEMRALAGRSDVQEKTVMSGMEVIGVYSPVRHDMQIPFSLVFASFMAEKRKVLYINLMEYTGFFKVYGNGGEYDMGDIVVRLRNNRLLPEQFGQAVYAADKIRYIPPFHNPENLHELTLEDFLHFIGFLSDRTDFEMLVIDFGEGMDRLAEMLKRCTSVYCPVKKGYFYESRTEEFFSYIERASDQRLAEKIRRVELPYSAKGIYGGGDVIKQLMFSEFGDYVRSSLITGTGEGQEPAG